MYGKLFASTFRGSMVGAGLNVFAVWGYIIASANKDCTVEVNPALLAAALGCSVEEVDAALAVLESPDSRSRNKKEDGRRIIKQGEFLYFVPTMDDYRAIRNEDDRTVYMRKYMREYRAKSKTCDDVNVNVNDGKPPLANIEVEVEVEVERAKTLSPSGDRLPAEQASAGQELRSGTTRKRARQQKHAMPEDFEISERVKSWAIEKGHTRLADHLEAFKAKCKANGYAYADWDSAFMEAIRGDWAKLGNPRLSTVSNGGNSPAASRPL